MQINNIKDFHIPDKVFTKNLSSSLSYVLDEKEYSLLDNTPASRTKKYIKEKFKKSGYVSDVPLFYGSNKKIDLLKNNQIGIQIQFGNHAQVWFDVLKMGYLFDNKRIEAGVVITLNKTIANNINGGMTNFEDTVKSYKEFANFLKTPLVFVEIS